MNITDITDYDYVSSVLHRFELDLDTISKTPIFSEVVNNKVMVCGYKFFEDNEYFGAIFFESSTIGDYNKFFAIFDENGNMVYYEKGYSKSFMRRDIDKVENILSSFVSSGCILKFNKDSDIFTMRARSKFRVHFTTTLKSVPGGVSLIYWQSVELFQTAKEKYLEKFSKKKDKIFDNSYFSFLFRKNEFINMERSDNNYLYPGPYNSVFGFIESEGKSIYNTYRDEYPDYFVKFSIKKDSRIIVIDTCEDLEYLSAIYPTKNIILDSVQLQNEITSCCEFVDWDLVKKDFDVVYFTKKAKNLHKKEGVIVLNFSAIDKYNIVGIRNKHK
jgi:hypothetical protein